MNDIDPAHASVEPIWSGEARQLRERIDASGLSNSELARRSTVERAQIQRYLTGEVKPSRQSLARMAGPLGLPARDLIAIYEPVRGVMDEDLAKAVRELSMTVKELTVALRSPDRARPTPEEEAQARADEVERRAPEGSQESAERSTRRETGA